MMKSDHQNVKANGNGTQTEQALRASELSYRRLFEAARDGILILDVDTGRINDVNPFLVELLGFSRSEMVGKTVGELSPFKDIVANQAMLERLQEDAYVRYHNLPLEAKDGRKIAVEFVSNVYQDGGKKVIQCNIRDNTEYTLAEEALRASRQMLGEIINALPARVFWKDKNLIYLGCNTVFARDAGFAGPKDIIGKDDFQMGWREQAEKYRGDDREVIESGCAKLLIEESQTTPEGNTITLLSSKTPLRDSEGEIVGMLGTYLDITKRKRAEEELRLKTALLEAQMDSALDGILVVDHQGKQILRNERLNELWKIPPHLAGNQDDAAQAQFAASRVKNPREFAEKVAYLYSHPDEVSRDEIELIDGTVLDRYSSPVRDKAGKYYGRIWTFRDITQRRILEAQFRQSQKMEGIGQLAAGVAHDFNNTLTVIQLHASLLKAKPDSSPELLESAGEIEKATERAANLTRQLLLFSRRQTMQPRDLDLNQSINDMTKMLRRTLGEDIQVQFKFAMQPLFIHADAGMLDQVLMNLAVNAHDAMPKGGLLVIETSAAEFDESVRAHAPLARPGSFVCLSVSDTGCGIPPEILPRIFEPFFTTKDIGKGTGLGLATVYGIVQQHQGWIHIYSEVGHGTIFRIYLPRLAAKSGQDSGQSELTAVRGGKETILLVEDEVALRSSMHKALSQLGYHVLESVSGVETLKVWEQHRKEIDLLLTDMVMPGGMTGKDLAARLLNENPKLKVIYTSGYSIDVVGRNFPLEEGVNFLAKPFGAHRLAQTVRNCLDRTCLRLVPLPCKMMPNESPIPASS
jgi:two-component system cell cycle sensor histidine kinase/response regulator CckA